MNADSRTALDYYAAHGCALFPIPAGQKSPTGIVESFAMDCTTEIADWEAWAAQNPGCNWGVVAGPSNLVIADVDVSEVGRERAWALWCEWCTSAGIEPPAPHVQSARGGWHYYFRVPEGVDARQLRQVALIGKQPGFKKAVVDVRAGNGFTVAAGSYYDGTAKGEASGSYALLSDAPPYPAPAALIEHCQRAEPAASLSTRLGDRDPNDVAALVRWLAERDQFSEYEDWIGIGMALKIEYGDAGFDLWALSHDDTVTDEISRPKWTSFADDPNPGSQTLASWLKRARDLGWRGSIRQGPQSMFGDAVAALAQSAGATLPHGSLFARGAVHEQIGKPILDGFLADTATEPSAPVATDCPELPPEFHAHPMYVPLRQTIERVVAMAEAPGRFKAARVLDALAVVSMVHPETADAIFRKIRTLGGNVPDSQIRLRASRLNDSVERAFVQQDDWIYDHRGEIEHDNSDNVGIFLSILSLEIRWNAWLDRAEIRGGADEEVHWSDWTYIDDTVVAKLRTRANRTKTRFRPGKEFFWESLLALAQRPENMHDPARARLDDLESEWDGTPRLVMWLSAACGVPCDPYHQAVGRNIVGGMVRRIRNPGCKHDTMAVFFGPQGTGKSTLAAILADMGKSTLQQIRARAGRWFTDSVMLGDASKELVLSLAGQAVVEISEMGMRGNANPAHVKKMLSTQVDAGRAAYARAVSERPRRNIFVGTTNDDQPLMDATGNRRFLPIHVPNEIDLAWLEANIAQVIGEAATLESSGADFSLPREVWAAAAAHQEAARAETDIETRFADWLSETDMTGPLTWITASDVVELAQAAGSRVGSNTGMRGAIMKHLGFRMDNAHVGGKRTRVWLRAPGNMSPSDVVRNGTRYSVAFDNTGRPRVAINRPNDYGTETPAPPPSR